MRLDMPGRGAAQGPPQSLTRRGTDQPDLPGEPEEEISGDVRVAVLRERVLPVTVQLNSLSLALIVFDQLIVPLARDLAHVQALRSGLRVGIGSRWS